MERTKVAWQSDVNAPPGSLVRWRSSGNEAWEYGIYQGLAEGAIQFSRTPYGPVVVWLRYVPAFIEVATVVAAKSGGE